MFIRFILLPKAEGQLVFIGMVFVAFPAFAVTGTLFLGTGAVRTELRKGVVFAHGDSLRFNVS